MIFIAIAASAVECDTLQGSGDGVPAEYYIYECKGNEALAAGNGRLAEEHFRKALAVKKFEAPNYLLKVELAESLCMQGQVVEARRQISLFRCMAGVDLGQIKCPLQHSASRECAAMCKEFGSGMTEAGRNALLAREAKSAKLFANCGKPN